MSSAVMIDINNYPKLDNDQAGHLRHFYNLVSQPDGDWHHFGTADAHEEFDDASRYQLATMAYAVGAAHYHRLPALRGPLKALMRQIIHKMLRREVWSYWFNASPGGNVFDPDLKELRKPWADPVINENIMYSGHLLLMTSLHAMLFNDDEFEREGGIVFKWNPLFWGMGSEDFVYDNRKLQEVILRQMEENNWVGVCCEPNAIFVVCNQFPLVAMRYNDIRDGTNFVEDEILPKYKAALSKFGMLGEDGLYASYFALKQQKAFQARHGAHTAWQVELSIQDVYITDRPGRANAFMNAWNPVFVRSSYDKQTLGFLTHFNNVTELHPTSIAIAFRHLVEEGNDPNDKQTFIRAQRESVDFKPKIPFETLNWLALTMMLSELGKTKELNDLLNYADTHLNPTWEKGGLYYPRNGTVVDDNYNLIYMEPHSGNAGIGYARLNVVNGQHRMWNESWARDLIASRPWIDGNGLAEDIDFLRGVWDEKVRAIMVTVRRWNSNPRNFELCVKNLPAGKLTMYVNGHMKGTEAVALDGELRINEEVGKVEVDIILQYL